MPTFDAGRFRCYFRWSTTPSARVVGTQGELRLLPAGRQDAQDPSRVNSFAWDRFYLEQSGGPFFEAVRESMRGPTTSS